MRGTLANSPQLSMISVPQRAKAYQWISLLVRDISLRGQRNPSRFSVKIVDLGKCETIHLNKRGAQHTMITLVISVMNREIHVTKQSRNRISNQKYFYGVDINKVVDVGKQNQPINKQS